jgi:hypothetical protein
MFISKLTHDNINIILILLTILIVLILIFKKSDAEHLIDGSMFDTGYGNYKKTDISKEEILANEQTLLKLEELEKKLLDKRYYNDKVYRFLRKRDMKALYDPLEPPEQRVEQQEYIYKDNEGDLDVNISTHGYPDRYQMMGLLSKNTSDDKTLDKHYILFGRRTYPYSPQWEYYIMGKDNGGLEYKFPLNTNNQEILDNSSIMVPIDNTMYQVKLYNYDQYKYNPYVY